MNYQYQIPREINSEIKFGRFLTMTNLLVGVLAMMVAIQLQNQVAPAWRLLFLIYALLLTVLALLPCRTNPGRKYSTLILLLIIKKRSVWHPIENPNFDSELEEFYVEAQKV